MFSSIQKKQITSGFACLSSVQKNDHIAARFGHFTKITKFFSCSFYETALTFSSSLSEFSLYFLSSTPLFNSFVLLLFSSELNTNYFSFRHKIYTVFIETSSLTFHWTRLKTSPLISPSKFLSLPFFWRQTLSHPTTTTLSFKWTWFGMWHFSHFSWIWITSKETNRLTELYRSNATGVNPKLRKRHTCHIRKKFRPADAGLFSMTDWKKCNEGEFYMIGDPGFLGCVRYIFVTRSHSFTFTFTFYSIHLTFEDYWLGWPAKTK